MILHVLQCDKCRRRLEGKKRELVSSLRARAKKRGWDKNVCPDCVKMKGHSKAQQKRIVALLSESKTRSSTQSNQWVACLSNHTDHRDDETVSITANSYEEAMEKATSRCGNRFSVRCVMTKKEWGRGNWA